MNTRIVLANRPAEGPIPANTFKQEQQPIPRKEELKDGEVIVRVMWLSLDPAMRGWLRDARSYIPPVKINEVMRAAGVGKVVASKCPKRQVGDEVEGTFGWQDKCKTLKELGCHAVINYKDQDWRKQFKDNVGFFDIYFDNVGGEMLDFALTRMNPHAKIVMCGAISDYNSGKPYRLANYQALIAQKGTLQGFIVMDYTKRYHEGRAYLGKMLNEGKLKYKYHVVDDNGVKGCEEGLRGLFQGVNEGKMVVKVWDGNMERESKL
ncbi:hypothetical protein QFC19_002989 [Naganishia cerealis]|uniref:Uncharacterized protein n=1 Tax=Naganishia cerealis TaxID=610337 RepID=A0ACC2W6Y0_9TREE|nr:hypothetical protein QFC19_002989 [Naganishia cerealis]